MTDTNTTDSNTTEIANTTEVVVATSCPAEFQQAINDSFEIIGQTYDLSDDSNKEVFDLFKSTLLNRFSQVKPREITTNNSKTGKKPRSVVPYNLYISARFAEHKKNPESDNSNANELMSKFAKEWKDVDVETRKKYEDLAEVENQKLFPEKKNKKKNNPRPMSGYNFFLKQNVGDFKNKFPDLSSNERMSEIGKAWRALTDVEKETYKQNAINEFQKVHPDVPIKTKKTTVVASNNVPNTVMQPVNTPSVSVN